MAESNPGPHRPQSNSTTIAQRIQAVALIEAGIAIKIVATTVEVSHQTVYKWRKIAIERGYDPKVSKVLKEEYVTDAPRSGRPPKVTPGVENPPKPNDDSPESATLSDVPPRQPLWSNGASDDASKHHLR